MDCGGRILERIPLRCSKAATIYMGTGNLRAVQILLGRTNFDNTVRYLAIDIEDTLELADKSEF